MAKLQNATSKIKKRSGKFEEKSLPAFSNIPPRLDRERHAVGAKLIVSPSDLLPHRYTRKIALGEQTVLLLRNVKPAVRTVLPFDI